jgi:hypothetical protein
MMISCAGGRREHRSWSHSIRLITLLRRDPVDERDCFQEYPDQSTAPTERDQGHRFPLRGSLRNSALRLRAAPSACGPVLRCALPRGRSALSEAATNRRPATTVDSPRRLSLDTGKAAHSLRTPRPRAVSSARPSERSAPHCHEASAGTPGPIHPSPCRVGAV